MTTEGVSIQICSFNEIGNFAFSGIHVLVSAMKPEDPERRPDWIKPGNHLVLAFYDSEKIIPGFACPTQDHIRRLLDFFDQARKRCPSGLKLLVHYHKGRIRSPALALSMLCRLLRKGKEEAFACLLEIQPGAFSNQLLVDLSDQVLGLDGALSGIVRDYQDKAFRRIMDRD